MNDVNTKKPNVDKNNDKTVGRIRDVKRKENHHKEEKK